MPNTPVAIFPDVAECLKIKAFSSHYEGSEIVDNYCIYFLTICGITGYITLSAFTTARSPIRHALCGISYAVDINSRLIRRLDMKWGNENDSGDYKHELPPRRLRS